MANIVICTTSAISHLFQTFNFANDLKARGHAVTYLLIDDSLRSFVESRGFRFHQFRMVGDYPANKPPSRLEKLVPMARWLRRFRWYAQERRNALLEGQVLQSQVETFNPDLVVLETNLAIYALPLVGRKIPVILVCQHWPCGYRDGVPYPDSHFIPTSSRLSRYRSLFDWARFRTGKYIKMKLFGYLFLGVNIFKYYRWAAKRYGLSSPSFFKRERPIEYLGLPEVCLCPAAFDFQRPPRPDCYFLDSGVRPDDPEGASDEAFPWDRLSQHTPMVFCSFGTILSKSRRWQALVRKVLRKIIQAFSDQSDFQLVVSVGAGFEISESSRAPDRIIITNKWVPQLKMLRRASVHITHGGFSSVRESIEYRVPMIVIPFDVDQPGNAARVVYHKLGFRVMPRQVAGGEIVELCRQLNGSPAYKENIRKMKLEFDRQRAKQSAADLIESHLSFGRSEIASHIR